jgi:outer membrane protein OmpA-like peptidoglycan-associated protein
MLKTSLLSATLLAAMPVAAWADTVPGPYVSLGAGYNFLQDQYQHTDAPISGIPGADATRFRYSDGFNGQGSIGYGLGNGLRVELEGDYYYNEVGSREGSPLPGTTSGTSQSYGAMVNVLYDLNLTGMGIPTMGLTPYVGLGGGYQWNHLSPLHTVNSDGSVDNVGGTVGAPAYQGIVGVAYPVAALPGLDLTLEYRYLGTVSPNDSFSGTHYQAFGTNKGNVNLSNEANQSVMLGVRYALFQPPPPAPPAPAPAQAPAPPVVEARTYLVFFDWDRSDLTARARQIVAEAASASTHVQTTRIDVNGYTDLSGTAAYNQKLSVRRAMSVEAELVRDGVAQSEIDIHGYGESNPLVPTAAGVREPQNRRVEIILH